MSKTVSSRTPSWICLWAAPSCATSEMITQILAHQRPLLYTSVCLVALWQRLACDVMSVCRHVYFPLSLSGPAAHLEVSSPNHVPYTLHFGMMGKQMCTAFSVAVCVLTSPCRCVCSDVFAVFVRSHQGGCNRTGLQTFHGVVHTYRHIPMLLACCRFWSADMQRQVDRESERRLKLQGHQTTCCSVGADGFIGRHAGRQIDAQLGTRSLWNDSKHRNTSRVNAHEVVFTTQRR